MKVFKKYLPQLILTIERLDIVYLGAFLPEKWSELLISQSFQLPRTENVVIHVTFF